MTKKLQSHITTIVGTLVTVLLSLVSDFLLKLPTEITWLTFSIGAIITITITLLEQRLLDTNSEEINRKLEIYRLLSNIGDDELLKRGHTAIEECRTELENLAKGVLRIESPELYQYLIKTSGIAKYQILGTHIGFDELHMNLNSSASNALQTSGVQQWFERKHKLMQQGIRFERIYILPRNISIDNKTGRLNPEIIKHLEKQQSDGVSISVVWQEDIDKPDLIQDISIFDNKIALVIRPAWTTGYLDITVYKNEFDVTRYANIYNTIRSKGRTLQDLDGSSNT